MNPYIRKYPNTWWLKRQPYFLFMIRELTSLFVAGYCIFLLVFLYKLSQGPQKYEQILKLLESPISIILHILAFILAAYHSITWFNLTPKVLVLRFGEEKVPSFLISGPHFAAWLGISAIIAWIISVM